MKVTSYGLFWRLSEINWNPGRGNRERFRLLGRTGAQRGKIQVADFRRQRGIYILYGNYGPCYVGLTKQRGLGQRLKEHLSDHLADQWNRFSWFGFWPISPTVSDSGIRVLTEPTVNLTEDTNTTIGDLEALLIRAIGPRFNTVGMNFKEAEEWIQIDADEEQIFLPRLLKLR